MKKVLLITYAFPPNNYAESYVTVKTMGNLPQTQTDVVYCQNLTPNQDSSLNQYVKSHFGKIYICKKSWMTNKYLGFIFEKIGLAQLPDIHILNTSNVLNKLSTIDFSQYSAVVTRSQWHSIHIAFLIAKYKFKIKQKWVACLSDPWVDNPYQQYNLIQKYLNNILEKIVFKTASKIIVTSSTIQKNYQRKYSMFRNKIYSIPHGFDPILYPKIYRPKVPTSPITIKYLGSFYGDRNPETIFKAIKLIQKKSNIIIEIIGDQNPNTKKLIDKYKLNDLVKILPSVNYRESLKLMMTADILLVIDAPIKNSPFFTSKVIDYLGSNRPILAITPKNSATEILLKQLNYPCFQHHQYIKLAKWLSKYILNPQVYTTDCNQKIINNYSIKNISQQFQNIINL